MSDQLDHRVSCSRVSIQKDRADGHRDLHGLIVAVGIKAVPIIKADAVAAEVAVVQSQRLIQAKVSIVKRLM